VVSYGPVAHPEPYGLTPPNTTAIMVVGCAGTVSASLNQYGFTIETGSFTRVQPSADAADQLNYNQLAPGDCTRGDATFEVPTDQHATAVLFNYSGIGNGRWNIGP
jgi:hypothetical protein